MIKWKIRNGGTESDAYIGDIQLSCIHNLREYKDGTRQYMIYLRVDNADSKEIITVTKVRGRLEDAQRKVEEFVQRIKEEIL